MTREHHYKPEPGLRRGAGQGPTSSYPNYSREYLISIAGKPTLKGSADPTFRGDASLHNPEDWLVAALASCHMLSFLALASRSGLSVVAYRDAAEGTMTFEGGHGQFTRVALHPRTVITEGSDPDLAHRLDEQAHEACFDRPVASTFRSRTRRRSRSLRVEPGGRRTRPSTETAHSRVRAGFTACRVGTPRTVSARVRDVPYVERPVAVSWILERSGCDEDLSSSHRAAPRPRRGQRRDPGSGPGQLRRSGGRDRRRPVLN